MERNEKKFWLPVAAVWLLCIAVTVFTLWRNRAPKTEIPEPRPCTESSSPETEKVSPENLMIIGTSEPPSPEKTAGTAEPTEEFRGIGTVRENTTESTDESAEKIVFQPETHIIPLPKKETVQPAEIGTGTEKPDETKSTEALIEITQTEKNTETEKEVAIRTEAPAGIIYDEESGASDPGTESVSMLPYEYVCSESAGITRRENYEDRFSVSFHRTASGETMSFDYITYDTRWISALEQRYPEEDQEHAASLKARFSTRGSVYSYRVSAFRDGVSWINILPDDRIVIVEEGGKDGIRYYAAEGCNREILPDK